jgi:succinate-semialdehyde dehydrogenase/glutarate-semialdehyde dehydrogenase
LRFAVPAILAGNTVVLKHASICFGSGNAIEEVLWKQVSGRDFQNLEVGHKA